MPDKYYIKKSKLIFRLLIDFFALSITVYGYLIITFRYSPFNSVFFLCWIIYLSFRIFWISISYYNYIILKKPALEIHEDRMINRSAFPYTTRTVYLRNVRALSKRGFSLILDLDRNAIDAVEGEGYFNRRFTAISKFQIFIHLWGAKDRKVCRDAIVDWARYKEGIIIDEALW